MAKKNEPRKPWQDMTFRELDNKALIEHALSLGKKKGAEALTYLQQLDAEKIPFTAEMKQKRREELQKKKKRQKQGEKMVELDEPLYTAEQIEEMLSEITEAPKYAALKIKRMYCEKYYPEILPNKKDTTSFADEIAKALEQLRAGD